ncbi:MAG: hypothetical protein ACTSSH_03710 [Candidatus Heimdallarchaeota archaeon]
MKKINPKVTSLVILLMSLLISGGLAVQEAIGPAGATVESNADSPGMD